MVSLRLFSPTGIFPLPYPLALLTVTFLIGLAKSFPKGAVLTLGSLENESYLEFIIVARKATTYRVVFVKRSFSITQLRIFHTGSMDCDDKQCVFRVTVNYSVMRMKQKRIIFQPRLGTALIQYSHLRETR